MCTSLQSALSFAVVAFSIAISFGGVVAVVTWSLGRGLE